MRESILEALVAHAEGHIKKHKSNVEIFLTNPVGVGEHNDVVETIEKELNLIAQYEDQISVLKKHFKVD